MGWAVLSGNRIKQTVVDFGCYETDKQMAAGDRLVLIAQKLNELLKIYQIDQAGVEELYFFKNAKTVIRVAEARGVIVETLRRASVPVYDYTPLQIKQAVSGYGRASKQQVQQMVKSVLGLRAAPKPDDAADAVAVALTHFFTNRDLA